MDEPSAEWNYDERLAVIAKLASDLKSTIAANRWPSAREDAFRLAERIRFLASASVSFLEANRALILQRPTERPD